jgi:TolB-like protein/DNA-binding winged helix-turn-helix (wHTH) protein/Tfp pilus assembly protein PilF
VSEGQVNLAREAPFELGALKIDPGARSVRSLDGRTEKLEPRVMEVLVTLARAGGVICSREDLKAACWGGRAVSDDAVDRVIARIRRLSEDQGAGSFTLETIPKVGYRLKAIDDGGAEPSIEAEDGITRRRLIYGGGAAVAASVAGLLAWQVVTGRRDDAATAGPLTIAVLPFQPHTGAAETAGFARSLSDEVRSDLSRVTEVRVIAETSSRSAVEEGGSAREIGDRLGAGLLVEGQVSSEPGGYRVVANLVRVDDEAHIWSEAVSTPASDAGAIRTAISGAIIQQIASLIPLEAGRAAPARRPDPQAYALVSEANRLLEEIRTYNMRGRPEDALPLGDRAESLARRALAIDRQEGGAYAVLAALARNGWTSVLAERNLTTQQRVEQSISFVRRALMAESRNPSALTQLGDYYRRFAFRWDEAENLFRRALAIDPSLVEAHWAYGYQLGTIGRAVEGLDHALSVFELDPRNPFRRVALPRLLYVCGQRSAAMRCYDRELAGHPDNLFLLRELYFSFLSEGNARDLAALRGRLESTWSQRALTPDIRALQARIGAGLRAVNGDGEQLANLVDADVGAFDNPQETGNATPQGRARDDLPFIFAIEYAWAGRYERALEMLDRALIAKSLYWPASLPFGRSPLPAPVRNHPRFAALWRRDPGLVELVARRRRALATGQMAGFTSEGRWLVPTLPGALIARVRLALARP